MGIKLASHLKRNRFGLFYFRQVVPPDLRRFFAFKQISRSTGTSRRGEAVALALQYGASVGLLFERLRQMAKNKKPDAGQFDYTFKLDFEKDGTFKSILVDAQPGEEEAVRRLIPQILQVAQSGQSGKSAIPADAPRLRAEVDKYIEEFSNGGTWSPSTVLDVRGDFDQFIAVLGDVPVASLGHDELNRLKDVVLALPANMDKLAQTRNKTVGEVLALGLPPQSPNTVKKKWTRLTSFFDWLVGKGLIDLNYARGKKPKAKAKSYEKFNRDDLSKLFESDEYRTGPFSTAFQYWLPVLGLYTGARIEELAQLHLADIRQDTETLTWAIEITEVIDEGDGATTSKNLKNTLSMRTCPLHTAVTALGFPEYISDLKSKGVGARRPPSHRYMSRHIRLQVILESDFVN